MRLCCVYVPQLRLQAVLRRAPELRGAPAALTAKIAGKGKPRVIELTAEARAGRGSRRG